MTRSANGTNIIISNKKWLRIAEIPHCTQNQFILTGSHIKRQKIIFIRFTDYFIVKKIVCITLID
jgi:hypothetical protein